MITEQLERRQVAEERPPDRRRWAWLGVGALLWLLAVHGRFDVPVAAWLFPVFLLRFTRASRPTALPLVWLASVAAGVFWTVETAVPMTVITVVGVVALSTVVALPFALDRLVAPRAGRVVGLLLFPAALAACEFLMTVISPFGAAFGVLAPTQHGTLALLQVIGVTGPYGVAFLIGWAATAANDVWERGVDRRVVGVYALVLTLVLLGGGAVLAASSPGSTVRVAGISPDTSVTRELRDLIGDEFTPQGVVDRDPAQVRPAFEEVTANLLTRTREAARAGAKIVVWSEQAANVLAADEDAFLARAAATAREERIYLQVAVYLYLPDAPYAANRTYLFDPTGGRVWTYDKSHPIPGLEGYPAGEGVVPAVDTPYGRLATVTCFDADFPALTRVDADILLVPARDWAEVGTVHSQKAGLRAVENGYSVVRQAEFGTSGAVDQRGRVLAAHDYAGSETHVVHSDVPTERATTAYAVLGDLFAWLCVAAVVVMTAIGVRRPRT
ncbi:nitrilase-related carbon-nitrogen hydrolase [Umezawaea endophytica]|uniref:Apolipoprotein acyltransferase n=1 Tax=Umezawaea endophytica TaxID=1654476 RepID=A0A9X3AGD6_9PSEU|nr:nitrilase-related carbon-nitrogen hydrolase [Umezawaea endophytica]MCS7479476.1 apolipoprotein acyltransferase [Umezawaea endophytica]